MSMDSSHSYQDFSIYYYYLLFNIFCIFQINDASS